MICQGCQNDDHEDCPGNTQCFCQHKKRAVVTPKAWVELIEALTLLARGQSNDISPCHCEHDTLQVMADPANFTDDELTKLKALGFHPDEDELVFTSHRFGSA
jgi:hypothetical protein